MKVIDPGHEYQLDCLDTGNIPTVEILHFVKRIGEEYPGNHPPARYGTTTQEVIRALINRTEYVNAQRPDCANFAVVHFLRHALVALELRAASERCDLTAVINSSSPHLTDEIETMPTCNSCGHIFCSRSHA